MNNVYKVLFPMTCNILTPGHIRCLKFLNERFFVTVGLLTSKALEGYKKEIVPYEDRLYVLQHILEGIGKKDDIIEIVPQDSLDPSEVIEKYNLTAIASGDGFEDVELSCADKYGLAQIHVHLGGENGKKYSSSKIIDTLRA